MQRVFRVLNRSMLVGDPFGEPTHRPAAAHCRIVRPEALGLEEG